MRIKRKVALGLAVMGLGVGSLLVTPAAEASTAIYETYFCGLDDVVNGTAFYSCDGTWWNANPSRRSVNLYATATTDGAGNRNTYMISMSSLDGLKHTATWRCRWASGSISGPITTTTVGGSFASTFRWGGGGWNPCHGNAVGVYVNIAGTYGGHTDLSYIDINSVTAGNSAGYQRAHPSEIG